MPVLFLQPENRSSEDSIARVKEEVQKQLPYGYTVVMLPYNYKAFVDMNISNHNINNNKGDSGDPAYTSPWLYGPAVGI